MQDQSFYMIISATVYNAKIKDKAKLLYGHITSLCRQKGYCWATNDHLAKLLGVDSKTTVSAYISDLIKLGVINTQLIYAEDQKTVKERRIYLAESLIAITPMSNRPVTQNDNRAVTQTSKDNNITINNITINKELDVPSVDNEIKDFYGKIFFKIVEAYPKNRIGNRQHGLKKFNTLTKEEAKLAAINLKRYLKIAGPFVKTLQNYITEQCFTESWLKAEELNQKQKNQKNNDTTNNAKSFTDRDVTFF